MSASFLLEGYANVRAKRMFPDKTDRRLKAAWWGRAGGRERLRTRSTAVPSGTRQWPAPVLRRSSASAAVAAYRHRNCERSRRNADRRIWEPACGCGPATWISALYPPRRSPLAAIVVHCQFAVRETENPASIGDADGVFVLLPRPDGGGFRT